MRAAAPTASTLILALDASEIKRQRAAKATLAQLVSNEAQIREVISQNRQSEDKDWFDQSELSQFIKSFFGKYRIKDVILPDGSDADSQHLTDETVDTVFRAIDTN